MCRVDILGTHIVSTWYSLGNRVRHGECLAAWQERGTAEDRALAATRAASRLTDENQKLRGETQSLQATVTQAWEQGQARVREVEGRHCLFSCDNFPQCFVSHSLRRLGLRNKLAESEMELSSVREAL